MASLYCMLLLSFILFSSLQFYTASSTEFEVGGDDGWTVPSKHHDDIYSIWASKNRLKVNDTVRFKYKKTDSVIEVNDEEEYQKCQSSHPLFFSNNGDTVFKLDRPGFFYFISGVSGHCERGQKMIVKVLEPAAPPQSQKQNSSAHSEPKKNGTAEMAAFTSTSIFMFILIVLGLH